MRQYIPKSPKPTKSHDDVEYVCDISACQEIKSLRNLNVFAADDYTCQRCKVVASFVGRKPFPNNASSPYQYMVFAVNSRGENVPLTADHVIPKCRGGTNRFENLQTLCEQCNHKKGASW